MSFLRVFSDIGPQIERVFQQSLRTSVETAGGQPREHSWFPKEEGHATADTGSDQPRVPAKSH